MPSISSPYKEIVVAIKSERIEDAVQSNGLSTPHKRRLRSHPTADVAESPISTPTKRKSPRTNAPANGIDKDSTRKLSADFMDKPNWNPRDMEQLGEVKEALHVSTQPSTVACREEEQKRIFDFCRACIEQEKAGSLYVCGCPGTGKSLSMEKVKHRLINWAEQAGFQPPDVLATNCTSLSNTSEIFSKIIRKHQPREKISGLGTHLQYLQNLYSQPQSSSALNMMLIIADELDYLITKDWAVLHDLFMLTTFPYSRCILIGIANAINLADRFLPRLQSLNCKPTVVTFRAYSKDQIFRILQERLQELPHTVFHTQALELCARKVAAASGDMRKALSVCRSAVEILETELRECTINKDSSSMEEKQLSHQQTAPVCDLFNSQQNNIVRIDHMAIALSKAFRSSTVDIIQSLPHHQQIILCSAVKLFRGGKKDTTVGELNKSYLDICRSTMIPPVGILEFSSMCRVLNDQGLLKVGQSRADKSKRVTLKADEADINFALQGVRFFRNCFQ